jgi:hypothetical protein
VPKAAAVAHDAHLRRWGGWWVTTRGRVDFSGLGALVRGSGLRG